MSPFTSSLQKVPCSELPHFNHNYPLINDGPGVQKMTLYRII